MSSIEKRLAGLSPEKRRLLQKRLAEQRRATATPGIQRSGETRAPLTFAQRRLWFLEQLAPGSPVYNNPSVMDGCGAIDIDALTQAIANIVHRHEILRTRFVPEDEEAFQEVVPDGSITLPVEDLRSLAPEEREHRIRNLLRQAAEDPFDLVNGPPVRALMILRGDEQWTLAITFHHLVSDAWSSQRFLAELVAGYRATLAGRELALTELPIQYGDFARWQRSEARNEELDRQRAWWLEQLTGAPTSMALPLDRPRRSAPSHAGDEVRFGLDRETTDALHQLAGAQEGTTLFMVLLAGFSALLHRLTGDRDLCLGTAIAGRNRPETEQLIGFFANTLVLRVKTEGRPTFRELVERARKASVGAFAHQDVPFEQLVEALGIPRSPSIHPLFQVMLVLQNVPLNHNPLADLDLELTPRATTTRRTRFDLRVAWAEGDEGLLGSADFATELFDRSTIVGWCEAYANLLRAAATHPDLPIGHLPLGLEPSIRLASEPIAEATKAYGANDSSLATVAQRFSAMAAQRGAAPAIGFEGSWWSYSELDARSTRLALRLAALGIQPESRIGIAADRGFAEWVGVLAIWKAGAAYVPMDPTLPVDRLAWIVESSGVTRVLTSGAGADLQLPDRVETLPLDAWLSSTVLDEDEAVLDQDEEVSEPTTPPVDRADRLAYILYTSGSTGRPKGVAVSQRSVLAFLDAMIERLQWTDDVRVLAVTTLGFDPSVLERWGPLLVGGTSQSIPAVETTDGFALDRRLASSDANVLHGTPATWRLLREAGWAGHPSLTALVGGEAFPIELAHWLSERGSAVWNLYGPTETTICATVYRFQPESAPGAEEGGTVELGPGLGAARLAVVDAELRPVPIGIWGELVIGGPGVARGYEGRPGETASRFIPDPFGASDPFGTKAGSRVYRSGDICRMLPDGGLEFGGRRDGQIKVRGFRIETGEIEARLSADPQIAASAVVVTDETLVAFVTPKSDLSTDVRAEVNISSLVAELSRSLPAYMVPQRFEIRSALPLNPSGKVDRRALAAEAAATRGLSAEYVAPKTPTESAVAEIFAEVLDLEQVSAEANFFELGGHSLLATRVATRIRERLGRDFSLRTLFEAPDVSALAARIDASSSLAAGPPLVAIPTAERPDSIPLSHSQERLWFLDQLRPGDLTYAIPLLLRLEGTLDADALSQALATVVQRHEVLRTTFSVVGGHPEQRIHESGSELARRAARIPRLDLSTLNSADQTLAIRTHGLDAMRAAFDLQEGPLMRTLLLRLDERSHLVILVMHHIVTDGWSRSILARELTELYKAHRAGTSSPLQPLPIQYADWAIHERAITDSLLKVQADHWSRALAGVPTELDLPADRPRTDARRAARFPLRIRPELTAGAQDLARAQDATLFMVLLAAYGATLVSKGSGDDLVIGCPSAGREDPLVESSIGFFINTLPLRLRFDRQQTLGEIVGGVRDATLAGLANRRIPFAHVAKEAAIDGRTPRSLEQLWFVLQNVPSSVLELGDLTIEPLAAEEIAELTDDLLPARYDLKLDLQEEDGAVSGGFEYRMDRFDAATVERFAERFIELLEAMVQTPDRTLSEWTRHAADRAANELADHRRRGLAGLRARRAI